MNSVFPQATVWQPELFTMDPKLGDQHLTAEQFVAALPQSREQFVPYYLDYDNTEDNVGYQGRDTWKQMEKDVYSLQFDDELMDQVDG